MGRILIVDDEPAILQLLRVGLEKDDHTVISHSCADDIDKEKLNH